MSWQDEQHFESDWWGNCVNTFWEETKQLVYAKRMGLQPEMVMGKYPVFDLHQQTVLDIGGGPVSLLLKCVNVLGTVIDPCDYPFWVEQRYQEVGIAYIKLKGEDIQVGAKPYDEVWIYNVLQHVDNPKVVIQKALQNSKVIRLFEWINNGVSPGHPHDLKEEKLNEWLGGVGKTEILDESGCRGQAYYGIFKGKYYEEV